MAQNQTKVKSVTGGIKTQHRRFSGEKRHNLDEAWEYAIEQDEDVKQIALVISKYGSIESEL